MWEYNYSYPYIAHHGILGQKWGIRRYQNEDGSLTPEGKARLQKYKTKIEKQIGKRYDPHIKAYEKTMQKKELPEKAKQRYKILKEKRDKLIKRCKNMKYSDIKKYKNEKAKRLIQSCSAQAVGGFIGSALWASVDMYQLYTDKHHY